MKRPVQFFLDLLTVRNTQSFVFIGEDQAIGLQSKFCELQIMYFFPVEK